MKDEQIRIGVVGIGHLGTYHLQKYALLPDCRIAGVTDTDLDRAVKAAETYSCEAFQDHRDLIGKVDAVSIAVPTRHHYAIARDFLAAGVDVLLEKPMTATLGEADELIRLARAKRRILQVGFVERFNPAIVALEKVMGDPMFIETHRLHPFFNRGTDVDVVLDLMIHDLDLILHFVKAAVLKVEATGISVLSENIDIANARVIFRNGCVANITSSRITGKKMQKIRFFGMEGYHSVDYEKRELVSLSRKKDPDGSLRIADNNVTVVPKDPLESEIAAFVQSVITRRQPAVSGEEGRKSLRLALRILDAMKKNQEKILNATHG